jgi:hypothetical protein
MNKNNPKNKHKSVQHEWLNKKMNNYHWNTHKIRKIHEPLAPPQSSIKPPNYTKVDTLELQQGEDIVNKLNDLQNKNVKTMPQQDAVQVLTTIRNWGRGSKLTKATRSYLNEERYKNPNNRFLPIVKKPLRDPVIPFKQVSSRDYKRTKISENVRKPNMNVMPFPIDRDFYPTDK